MSGTARLLLRPPRLADAPALLAFMGDPAAMRWTHAHAGLRALRRYLAGHACARRRNGFGPWTLVDRYTAAIIGLGGLYEDPFDPGWGLEVGYFLAPAAWGRGYASELVAHCLATAWASGQPSVRAFVHPDNAASRRVLEKNGFMARRFIPEMARWLLEAVPTS